MARLSRSSVETYQLNWHWSLGVLLVLLTITLLITRPLAIVYALARARPWREFLADRRLWICALVALATALFLVGPAARPYLQAQKAGGLAHPLSETDHWSAFFTDYLIPSLFHPLWGPWVAVNRPAASLGGALRADPRR